MSRVQFRNCASKRRFVSKTEALEVALDKKLGVYSCPVCSGFHLTSQTVVPKSVAASFATDLAKPNFDRSIMARIKWVRPK